MKEHWLLDPSIAFLNHGSFGATPRVVLAKQEEFRQRMEREPVLFLARELEPLLDDVRAEVAAFVGAAPEDLALLPNATAGVNAVLRSLDLDKHDELLVTNHEYMASRNALDYVASLAGAKVVTVDIPFPIASADVIVERVLAAVTPRTRLFLVDHISSQTALVFPVERLIAELQARGIDTLVDGAHAPGQLPLDLSALGAAYYAGNLHKWVCAPKGAAFLYVRRNRRYTIHPSAISHGYSAMRRDRSRFHLEFDWTGTFDPSAWLAVPEALRFVGSLLPGGWPEVRSHNHALALRARDLLCDALQIETPAPDDLLGSMAAVPLPDGNAYTLQRELFDAHAIEVPVIPWPEEPKRLLRVCAMLYNEVAEYGRLAEIISGLSAED